MSIRKRKMVSGEAGEGRCGKWVQQSATRPEGGAIDAAVSSEELRSQYFSTTDKDGLRLGQEFFNQPCVCLAKAFLGKVLVRRCADGTELRARVVETEAYLGGDDKASHSAGGKRTERNTAMFMKPGTIYVYQIYGIYLCMNVSSQGEGAAVLLRSLEPLQGQAAMRERRAARRREGARPLKDTELCNGPSKLCQALDVPRSFDRRDLAADAEVWLESDSEEGAQDRPLEVVSAPRVGIESSGEWAARPLRFYLRGHPCVSVVNREAERRTPPQGHQHGEQGGREDDTATAQRWDISSAGVEQ